MAVETKNKLVSVESVKELYKQIQSEISKLTPKLESYPLPLIEAETDGQTEFTINLNINENGASIDLEQNNKRTTELFARLFFL